MFIRIIYLLVISGFILTLGYNDSFASSEEDLIKTNQGKDKQEQVQYKLYAEIDSLSNFSEKFHKDTVYLLKSDIYKSLIQGIIKYKDTINKELEKNDNQALENIKLWDKNLNSGIRLFKVYDGDLLIGFVITVYFNENDMLVVPVIDTTIKKDVHITAFKILSVVNSYLKPDGYVGISYNGDKGNFNFNQIISNSSEDKFSTTIDGEELNNVRLKRLMGLNMICRVIEVPIFSDIGYKIITDISSEEDEYMIFSFINDKLEPKEFNEILSILKRIESLKGGIKGISSKMEFTENINETLINMEKRVLEQIDEEDKNIDIGSSNISNCINKFE